MCSLAICCISSLQFGFQLGYLFIFPVSFYFFFFCGYKFFKDNLQFFLLVLFEAYFVFLKLGLSPGWPGTWSKQFDCFTSQNAEFTGTSHHAWLKNSFILGKLQFFSSSVLLRNHPNPNLQKLTCVFIEELYIFTSCL